jgi:hypothetical protein
MPSANNVIYLKDFKHPNQQALIDHIGAQAFDLLRDSAAEMKLPMREVIAEHMLGLSLVMASVEGSNTAKEVLNSIAEQIDNIHD